MWFPMGETQRPGAKSLENQIREVVRMADGRKIVLIDDGCWTGDSAMNIIGKIIVRGVVLRKLFLASWLSAIISLLVFRSNQFFLFIIWR